MVVTERCRVTRPVASILMPGTMPAMRRRPSHTRWRDAVPSHSSASRAGVSSRGRSVTERISPRTVARLRSRASTMWMTPTSVDSWRSSAASSSCDGRTRSARRRSVPPRTDTSADLGDLGAAIEGAQVLDVRGALGGVLTGVLPGLLGLGKAQREQLARRHGLLAAVDDRGADDLVHGLGGRGLDRGTSGDHGTEEPTRAVDADEAGRHEDGASVGAVLRHPGQQLLAEVAGLHLGGAAGVGDALGDLVADLDPDALGARGREGLQLDGRLTDDRRDADDLLLLLVDLEAQLHVLLAAQPDRAEVEVVGVVVDRPAVERAGQGRRGPVLGDVVGPVGTPDTPGALSALHVVDERLVVVAARLAAAEESHVIPSL